jgi:hypothetical protein
MVILEGKNNQELLVRQCYLKDSSATRFLEGSITAKCDPQAGGGLYWPKDRWRLVGYLRVDKISEYRGLEKMLAIRAECVSENRLLKEFGNKADFEVACASNRRSNIAFT